MRALFACVVLITIDTSKASGQVQSRPTAQYVQLGLAAVPGAGATVGYVSPRGFYSVGAMLYADATPSFSGGEGSLLLSFGLGGAIRPLGAVRMIANTADPGYEVDLGVRIGPSLFFAYGESSRRRNPFSLFIDPFGRITSNLGGRRTFFIELGIQRPLLRGGLWLGL